MSGQGAKPTLPALDPASVTVETGTDYPAPFAKLVDGRTRQRMGDVLGLSRFGVNLVRLAPGAASSQRHWHTREDEFVYIIEGELVLVTDAGEQTLRPGMVAGFPSGKADGHHLLNRSDGDAVYLEVGSRDGRDEADYPDIDLQVKLVDGKHQYTHKDGTPY